MPFRGECWGAAQIQAAADGRVWGPEAPERGRSSPQTPVTFLVSVLPHLHFLSPSFLCPPFPDQAQSFWEGLQGGKKFQELPCSFFLFLSAVTLP